MPQLKVANEVIHYSITYSLKAKHSRIVIAPSGVKVVLPQGSPEQEAVELIEKMKRRVYLIRERILKQDKRLKSFTEVHYASGAKIPFLGNEIQLTVFPENRKRSRVEYDDGLIVRVQAGLTPQAMEREVRRKVEGWIKQQVHSKALEIMPVFGII
jgi:predicted metal-dependent hydrolase